MDVMPAVLKRILSGALCLLLVLSASQPAFAADGENGGGEASTAEMSIIDPEELQALVDGFIEENKLNADNISIGYCYTATGDTWYYNEDKWYYSASMYKVPLMMNLAELEAAGELSQDSNIKGLTLAQAEEYILVYSNNDYAHLMMSYFGTDRECRELYQKYSDLPVEEYDPDFYDYSYFTARFMTDVMKTLYSEPERFPSIIDCLKRAQPENYFNASLGDKYEIAQKYGSYKEFNHTTGIIYTPNPFILTVMTEHNGNSEATISGCALLMEQYTLSLDEKLAQYQQELEEKQQAEEEERQVQEEQQRAEEEQRRQEEEEARQKAEEERQAREEQAAEELARRETVKRVLIAAGAAAAIAAAVLIAVHAAGRGRRGPGREAREKTAMAAAGSPRAERRPGRKGGRGGYTPKH